MAEVSIILPTYNRADTIGRAITSVVRQTFLDWELIVVDDGSTDDTAAAVDDVDSRIRLIRQPNAGCYVARNTGLRHARGHFITFIDSDDEWLPHFLEITTAFLRWSPDDHFVTTEFLEVLSNGRTVRHDVYEISDKYPKAARRIGSTMLELPPGETDDYLRVYESREPLGEWGQEIAARAGHSDAALYRGRIFECMRWGYLNWLPATMITRHAAETIGPFTVHTRSAADFRYLGLLCRHFRANMIALPSAIKHLEASGNRALAQDHLATGSAVYNFALNHLSFFDELFWRGRERDMEIRRIRSRYLLYAGRTALALQSREAARAHLREAQSMDPTLWRARTLRILVQLVPSARLASTLYRLSLRLMHIAVALFSGQMRPRRVMARLFRRRQETAGL
jgi:glycosyltransferase involved in cell wall biosynthesis